MKDNGFTLIETMVAIAVLGILAAIAAPGWMGFVQQRRLSAATDQVYQTLKISQSEAKRFKIKQSPTTTIKDIDSSVVVTFPSPTIQFDYRGNVADGNLPYRIDLTISNNNNYQRCVVVRTILGSIATGKNAQECNTLSNASG